MVITVKVPNSGSAYSAYAMALGTKLLQLLVILKYWILSIVLQALSYSSVPKFYGIHIPYT